MGRLQSAGSAPAEGPAETARTTAGGLRGSALPKPPKWVGKSGTGETGIRPWLSLLRAYLEAQNEGVPLDDLVRGIEHFMAPGAPLNTYYTFRKQHPLHTWEEFEAFMVHRYSPSSEL